MAAVAVVRAGGLLGVGAPLLAPAHWGLVSAQSTAIKHVVPVKVAAAPLVLGHGIAAPLGLGHGIAAPLGLGHGIVSPIGIAAAPLALAPLGLGHGLIGGNLKADGIVGSGVLASNYGSAIAHKAIVGHGVPLLGLGHGIGLGKVIL